MLRIAVPTAESDEIDYSCGMVTRQPDTFIRRPSDGYPTAVQKIKKPPYRCKYLLLKNSAERHTS
jgi:hypothetical protein